MLMLPRARFAFGLRFRKQSNVGRDTRKVIEQAVYVGRGTRHGDTRFGNWAAKATRKRGRDELAAENERCVRAYARYIASEERAALRQEVRERLKGRWLACHCSGSRLPCHAEILAVVANCPASSLDSVLRLCEACEE